MVQLQIDIDDKEFIDKLAFCINRNPNIMRNVLARAMQEFDTIGRQAALSGGQGLAVRTGKTFRAGFLRRIKSTKKNTSGIFWARIANIYQGTKKKSTLPTIKIMKLAEKAFRKSGAMQRILQDEMERVYNG